MSRYEHVRRARRSPRGSPAPREWRSVPRRPCSSRCSSSCSSSCSARSTPEFLSGPNLATIVRTAAFAGIVAVGMTILLVTGEFDLSVGSVAGLGAVSAALAMQASGSVAVGVFARIGVGAAAGVVNGLLTVAVGIPAFIVTLGTLFRGSRPDLCAQRGQTGLPTA